jgi:hypothetical protein
MHGSTVSLISLNLCARLAIDYSRAPSPSAIVSENNQSTRLSHCPTKPKQDVNVAGGIVHAHVRDRFLAALPKEALEALARSYDEVLAKYAIPVLNGSQDGPQNQIESKPAIEAEVVELRTQTGKRASTVA